MERALLQGEVTAQLEKIQQDEKWLQQLQIKENRLGNELDAFRAQEGFKIQSSKAKMESIEHELNRFFCIKNTFFLGGFIDKFLFCVQIGGTIGRIQWIDR